MQNVLSHVPHLWWLYYQLGKKEQRRGQQVCFFFLTVLHLSCLITFFSFVRFVRRFLVFLVLLFLFTFFCSLGGAALPAKPSTKPFHIITSVSVTKNEIQVLDCKCIAVLFFFFTNNVIISFAEARHHIPAATSAEGSVHQDVPIHVMSRAILARVPSAL